MIHDLRYAVRRLVRCPGFTAAAVLTLAVGIGANTVVFTVVNTMLLGELPVPEPDRVVRVYTSDYSSGLYGTSSYPNFADYRDRAASFTNLAAYSTAVPMNLSTGGDAERVRGAVVTRDFFEVLEFRPTHGRFFPPGDDLALGSAPIVVLSHELWTRSFGAAPGAVGTNKNSERVHVHGGRGRARGVSRSRSARGVGALGTDGDDRAGGAKTRRV